MAHKDIKKTRSYNRLHTYETRKPLIYQGLLDSMIRYESKELHLITRRSQVQILSPQPESSRNPFKTVSFLGFLEYLCFVRTYRNIVCCQILNKNGVPSTAIVDICAGRSNIGCCSVKTVQKIAEALDCTMEKIVEACNVSKYDVQSGKPTDRPIWVISGKQAWYLRKNYMRMVKED